MKIKNSLVFIFIFASYFLAGKLGLSFATINFASSPFWPASGVAVGLLLIFGQSYLSAIALGVLFTNWSANLSPISLGLIVFGNTLEALTASKIISRRTFISNQLGPHYRLIMFFITGIISCTPAAIFGSLAINLSSGQGFVISIDPLITWLVGDVLGILLLVPLFISLVEVKNSLLLELKNKFAYLFGVLGIAFIIMYAIVLFPTNGTILFLIFPVLLITTYFFSSPITYILTLLIGLVAIYCTNFGIGPFTGGTTNQNLINLQLMLASLALTSIVLEGLKEEDSLGSTALLLNVGWLFTGFVFYSFFHFSTAKDNSDFFNLARKINSEIHNQFLIYVRGLESGVGLFSASKEVDRDEWHSFCEHLKLNERYPGLSAMGVIEAVGKDKVEEFINSQKQFVPGIKYTSLAQEGKPAANNPENLSLLMKYIEPYIANYQYLGLDIATESDRLNTALSARDAEEPKMTGRIFLVHDKVKRPAFHIYVPIYKNGAPILSVTEKREAFYGLVFAAIYLEDLIATVFDKYKNELHLEVYAGEIMDEESLIFQTAGHSLSKGSISLIEPLELGDQTFYLRSIRLPSPSSNTGLAASWAGLIGVSFTILIGVFVSTFQNTSRRAELMAKELNREVIEKEKLWRALTDVTPVGIFLTDADGNCTYVNREWTRMTGFDSTQAQGTGFLEAIHPADRPLIIKKWNQFMKHGDFNVQFRYLGEESKLANPVYVTANAVGVKESAGRITGYLGTVLDISELHDKQNKLINNSRLSSLGAMAAGVAHEINNPLAIISGKAQVILELAKQDKLSPEILKDGIEKILATTFRIGKIIRGLRSFARDDKSEPFKPSSIDEIVKDTLELCQSRFANNFVEMKMDIKTPPGITIKCRPVQLSQVILNLLNNAFDAVSGLAEKYVVLTIESRGEFIALSVANPGPQIPSDIRGRIFDPFFTTKEVGKGTGLGLSIAKGIIQDHKGHIYLEETSPLTTFTIEIPV